MTNLFGTCRPYCTLTCEHDFLSYEKAVKDIATKAAELGNPDLIQEESYLLWVMGRMMMIGHVPRPASGQWYVHPRGKGVKVSRQRVGRVEFCHLLFAPWGKIPLHDHYHSNGVMRVLEGGITSRSYDVVEQNLDGLVMQPSLNACLSPGRMVSFCRGRDSVHEVVAGKSGAYIIDVFTLLNEDAECRYLQARCQGIRERQGHDTDDRLIEATFV